MGSADINPALARKVCRLVDVLQEKARNDDLEERAMFEKVCEMMMVKLEDVWSRDSSERVSAARNVIYWGEYKLLGNSLNGSAQAVGRIDPSTAKAGIRRVEKVLGKYQDHQQYLFR
jgi:chromosomal replication initiation ATPase DnaA